MTVFATLVLPFLFWTVAAWLVFSWPALPGNLRLWITRLLLLSGILALGAAPFLFGGYSQEVVLYIGGPYSYRVETIERSFRALSMGAGIALIAVAGLAAWGSRLPWNTPVGHAVMLTFAVLILRIYAEKLGVPTSMAMFIGIIWLIVPVALYLGREAAGSGTLRTFWTWMAGYTYTVRCTILIIMLLATHLRLGTHFDNSSVTRYNLIGREYHVASGSWEQSLNLIIIPQLILWPAVTFLAGIAVGWPAYWLRSRRLRSG